jgi:argininosuccinate lyase
LKSTKGFGRTQSDIVTNKFPAPLYAETVLNANFEDAKRYFLTALLEIHYAHTLMLERQGIIGTQDAQACLRALDTLDLPQIQSACYDGSCEDLFFYIEQKLAERIDPDVAGKMHTARSRNDIDLTLYRLCARAEVLKIAASVLEARCSLLSLAEQHVESLMPAYTHTQPAQPTTLGHYLMAAVEFLGRDFGRLRASWSTINRNPLGACAITTTGFPIDRNYTAELLGFEGLQTNSYGAIAAVDYITEAASAVAVCMVNLGKLVQDLLQWCMAEFNFLRLKDAYVQTSSIMPQKRNPVSLEHTRILASKAFSQSQAVLTCTHNTPFGDIVDSEDDLQPLVFAMFEDASRALRLFTGVIRNCEVNREHMARKAQESFLTVTELADTLVREENLSFRLSHRLVQAAVVETGQYDRERMVQNLQRLAPDILGRRLETSVAILREALDAEHFIKIRSIPGGPAPKIVLEEIRAARKETEGMSSWIAGKREQESTYRTRLKQATAQLLERG